MKQSLYDVARQFTVLNEMLHEPQLLGQLRDVCREDEGYCQEIIRGIIKSAAFLDDSISNPHIGSIFDRKAPSPLNAMLSNIAEAYGVKEAVVGTTGTTGLNVPAVMSLAGQKEKILIGRDCHVSVINSLSLSGAHPFYLVPFFDSEHGVLLPPTPAEVADMLDRHPDIRAVVITLPTYHGLMGDIQGIVQVCHRRGVVLMVDEAHGPHYHFLRELGFPESAESAGADMVTQSTHKVLPALNQGSLLLFNTPDLLKPYEECQSLGFQSTSFSYLLLISVERAIHQMEISGISAWTGAVQRADHFRIRADRLPGVRVLDPAKLDPCRVMGADPTRVTLNVRETGLTAYQIAEHLTRLGTVAEMATPDVLLFLIDPSKTHREIDDAVEHLKMVLRSEVSKSRLASVPVPALPRQILTPRQARYNGRRKRIPTDKAAGMVSGETIGCYPPGSAIIVAGEIITHDAIEYLSKAIRAGGHLKRIQDDHFQSVEVIV